MNIINEMVINGSSHKIILVQNNLFFCFVNSISTDVNISDILIVVLFEKDSI